MPREMQPPRTAAASQPITENAPYPNVRVNRRSSMFDARPQTDNPQRERPIYINTEKGLAF
jgi:hypothetical protein